jgi:hypothetical protein
MYRTGQVGTPHSGGSSDDGYFSALECTDRIQSVIAPCLSKYDGMPASLTSIHGASASNMFKTCSIGWLGWWGLGHNTSCKIPISYERRLCFLQYIVGEGGG